MHITIGLIHNHDPKRNDLVVPHLQALLDKLREHVEASFIAVGWEAQVNEMIPSAFQKKWQLMSRTEEQWESYRGFPPQSRNLRCEPDGKQLRTASIEVLVADKHVRVWDAFIESASDYLVCFEDDVTFESDSISNFCNIVLKNLVSEENDSLLYVDLAGGLDIRTLGLGQVFDRQSMNRIFFKKIVTNTSCGYLMNRALVLAIRSVLSYNPEYRFLPSDWLLNRLFIDLSPALTTRCYHYYPSIFIHGSQRNLTKSTIKIEE